MEPLITITCNERGKEVEHCVYPFVFSEDNIKKFWNNAKKYPIIFGRDIFYPTIEEFLDVFFYIDKDGLWQTNNLFYIVDDFTGMLSLTNIFHPHDALMHFTFYDGRLHGREALIKGMIKYVIDNYGFNRLSAEIPAYVSKGVLSFVSDKIGLRLEGKKQDAQIDPKGNLVSVLMYGITKKETDTWEAQKHKQLVVEAQLL